MIDFYGRDGFVWWYGVVENRKDPLYLGRVQTRIFGWHTRDKIELPTSSLPWADVLMPVTSGSQTGVGQSPTGLVDGTWVVGFYRDGETGQEPVIFGSTHGIPIKYSQLNDGFNDSRLDVKVDAPQSISKSGESLPASPADITGYPYLPKSIKYFSGQEAVIIEYTNDERKLLSGKTLYPREITKTTTSKYAIGRSFFDTNTDGIFASKLNNMLEYKNDFLTIEQPTSAYDPIYPFNHVNETESGHLIEIDDTPSKERLHWFHRSGTFTEFHPKGNRVDRTVGHRYNTTTGHYKSIIKGNEEKHITKNKLLNVVGKYQVRSKEYKIETSGLFSIMSPSNDINIISGKNVLIKASDTLTLESGTIVRGGNSNSDSMKGDYLLNVQGSSKWSAGSINMSSLGSINISAFDDKKQMIGGISEEIVVNKNQLLGNMIAKKIRSMLGQIVLESIDPITGGIKLGLGPEGSIASIAIENAGEINMKSLLSTNISAITELALKGLVKAEIKGALIDIIADGVLTLEGKMIAVGGKSEPMILGKTFMNDLFMKHTHESSVGPTSKVSPLFASKVVSTLSKKSFVG